MARNDRVSSSLRQIYQGIVRDVFCVSNTMYRDERDKARDVAIPWLRLSGILSLRRHCLGLMAQRQLRDASSFMKEQLPSLVAAIALWVESGSGQVSAGLRAQVREASAKAEGIMQEVSV